MNQSDTIRAIPQGLDINDSRRHVRVRRSKERGVNG